MMHQFIFVKKNIIQLFHLIFILIRSLSFYRKKFNIKNTKKAIRKKL